MTQTGRSADGTPPPFLRNAPSLERAEEITVDDVPYQPELLGPALVEKGDVIDLGGGGRFTVGFVGSVDPTGVVLFDEEETGVTIARRTVEKLVVWRADPTMRRREAVRKALAEAGRRSLVASRAQDIAGVPEDFLTVLRAAGFDVVPL